MTTSGVMVTEETVLSDGMLNMMSVITFSVRRADRAPVLRLSAVSATSDERLRLEVQLDAGSISNMDSILLDERVSLLQNAHERISSSVSSETIAGRRPISSG